MPSTIFEPTIPASERPQTLALDRPATALGFSEYTYTKPKYTVWMKLSFIDVEACDKVHMKREFSRHILKKYRNIKLHENTSSDSRLFHADRQTDRERQT
jgi:hypothetical protein